MTGLSRAEEVAALGLAWCGLSADSCLLALLKDAGPLAIWMASERRLLAWGVGAQAARSFVEGRPHFAAAEAAALLSQREMRFIAFTSSLYPKELCDLEHPPAGLFVRGPSRSWNELLNAPRITIVGTRKASSEGLRTVEAFVRGFCARGISVISGMALGIDARAHTAALAVAGSTVAVLGCGADVVYPRSHGWLYAKLAETGAVASELPPGSPPTRWQFPRRNRLLAALGDAVLVVEGSITSGALQTAKWALELGRPVFSVPGSIFKEGSQGCNALLYEGATPALSPEVTVEDFLRETRMERRGREATGTVRAASGEQLALSLGGVTEPGSRQVLEALTAGPANVDGLVALTGLAVREVCVALGQLEVGGAIRRGGPGIYLRAP
jgi:DNA processing protein